MSAGRSSNAKYSLDSDGLLLDPMHWDEDVPAAINNRQSTWSKN